MVELKYNININENTLNSNLKRITNQIYKLLPSREEGLDWKLPLYTILEELSGIYRLLLIKDNSEEQENFLMLLSKLEGLFTLTNENDFFLYRRTLFECLRVVNSLMVKENE